MEITKFRYRSAVFFGVAALVLTFLVGLLFIYQLKATETAGISPELAVLLSQQTSYVQLLVWSPLLTGILTYIVFLIMILIYNLVAKRWPVSWEIKK